MATPPAIPTMTVDARLKPSSLPPGPAYWEPEETGACGLIPADRTLPGVGDWLDHGELSGLFRLLPWYAPCGRVSDWIPKRRALLGPVRAGMHTPIIRVNPERPWTLALAVSLVSPILDHPNGPESLDDRAEAMWRESVVPVGCANMAGATVGIDPTTQLGRFLRAVWVTPVAGMALEAMDADLTALRALDAVVGAWRRLLARPDGGIAPPFAMDELPQRFGRAVSPLLEPGIDDASPRYSGDAAFRDGVFVQGRQLIERLQAITLGKLVEVGVTCGCPYTRQSRRACRGVGPG